MTWQERLHSFLHGKMRLKKFRCHSRMWFMRVPGKPGFYYVSPKSLILFDTSGSFSAEEMREILRNVSK